MTGNPVSRNSPVAHQAAATLADRRAWRDLDESRRVILVTQGMAATNFEDLLLPAIRGLAEEDVLVVATAGNRALAGIERPGNLRLEPFLPFGRIMPFVDVIVTNGGYGGVHFALAHGVPLIVA